MQSKKEEAVTLISRLLNQLMKSDKYGERRGAAFGLAGVVKGFRISCLKKHNVMAILRNEPELAFADLEDDMACATAYLQYVVQYILENCTEDMDFFNTWIEKGIINRLSDVVERNFVQLTYSDAVELLLKAKKNFEFLVTWGCDLQSEHKRYITEEAFGGCPVIIRDYPKEIKAFYMRQNVDGKSVAAMDMLVPRVGELIGGSQREEERLEFLEQRLDDLHLIETTGQF
ncbi:hypothetical protein ACS0TY_035813 [Phlomoides rotata]